MRKATVLGWALTVLLCTTATQTAPQTPDDSTLYSLCEDESVNKSAPCHRYILKHYPERADIIIATLDSIDRQKDRARDRSLSYKFWDHIVSGTLILLAFLTTASAAVARTFKNTELYSVKLQDAASLTTVIFSALVTMMASFSTYYNFEEVRAKDKLVADQLATLQTKLNFAIIEDVSDGKQSNLEIDEVLVWQQEFIDIMVGAEAHDKNGSGEDTTGQ